MTEKTEIAYVLAGGKSRRMGSNKLSLIIDGMSMLERTIATCAASFDRIKLVAPVVGALAGLDYTVVQDSPGAAGPMAGVIAALEDCPMDSCFVTAADLIDLRTEVIELLVSQYQGQQFFGLKEQRGIQPLCGIYHVSAVDVFRVRARRGQFGMIDALQELNTGSIALPLSQWRNINCPEDLTSVEGFGG
jgi:molybdopterin-guanine dinucleotide biosynthesis protein A